jgi:outer membrane protein assembly factor BamB
MNDGPDPECRDSFPTTLEPDWAIPINSDTLKDVSNHLGMVLDHVYFQSLERDPAAYTHIIQNKRTAEQIWEHPLRNPHPIFTDGPFTLSNGDFLMHNSFATSVFDQTNGNHIVDYKAPADSAMQENVLVEANYLYRIHKPKSSTRQAALVELDAITGTRLRSILYLHRDQNDGFHPSFHSLQRFSDPNTEEDLLAFLMIGRNNAEGTSRVDLYVYNLSAGSMKYHYEDISESGNSSKQGLLIRNNKAYVQGTQKVYCYDLTNGTVLWERTIDDLSTETNLAYGNGILIINPENEYIIGLNADNGSPRWQAGSPNGIYDFSDPTAMHYHNGHVYFGSATTDRLSCIKVSTGAVIWNEFSPFAAFTDPCEAGFNTQIAIDEDQNLLFAHDNYFVMAFELDH